MSTQGAKFVRSAGKRLPFWQETPDAGTKLQFQSLPPFARCWSRAGSRAHQVSGRRQSYSGRHFVQHGADHRQFLQGYGNANMEKSGWAFAQCGYGERYHHRLCQEGQVSADERGEFHGCTCAELSCFWSHQRISLACRWIYSQPTFLCTLRSESLGHQEA